VKTTHDRIDLPTRPLPYYPDPKSDNQRLLNYQYEYKIKGDTAAINAMYALGCKIALKFINVQAGKNVHIAHMSDDEKEEKAHNAITYIIARYLRVKGFSIRKSFTSYLYLRVQHELYYQRKVDTIVDFVDWSFRGENNET
jgi:hypothetical protein